MILELAIIFSFQILFGYLYFQLGLLVTIFMAGTAAGSLFMSRLLTEVRNERGLFLVCEITIIAFAIFLPFCFFLPAPYLNLTPVYVLVYIIFLLLSFLSGALVGGQFPLANKIYLSSLAPASGSLTGTAGLLYGADLLGGFAGGLLGGIILLPLLGLKETCLLVAGCKAAGFILLLIRGAPDTRDQRSQG
jgi:spermidine synthase